MSKKHITVSIEEMTKLLLKENGISEGKYILGLDIDVAAGHMASPKTEARPSVLVGIESFKLIEVDDSVANSIDASEI